MTSVSWAERGDKVAVGTHRGFVQVMMMIIILILILKFHFVMFNITCFLLLISITQMLLNTILIDSLMKKYLRMNFDNPVVAGVGCSS